jgi:hypothetical protein
MQAAKLVGTLTKCQDELLTTYVRIFAIANDISRSQSRDDEGCRAI